MIARSTMRFAVLAACSVATAASAGEPDVRLPDGFALERASVDEGSFLALCFDERGRAIVGVEDGPIRVLTDVDGDALYEKSETFQPDLVACQGLAWTADALYAVARRGDEAGLWRIAPDRSIELLVPLASTTEHGAHGVALGPDGALYLSVGNEGAIATPPIGGFSLEHALDDDLLPTIADPLGVGSATRVPYGFVARVDPQSGAWGYHSIGYRNHCDVAFDREGEMHVVDSDMEYDVGLPWYRPVRALHARYGVDFGFRRGSSARPAFRADVGAATVDVGRGSPTGVAFGHAARFPAHWREALYCGDWALGRIVAVDLEARGASYVGRAGDFATGPAFASITALRVGPDGALYFARGGRGLTGPLQRVAWRGEIARDEAPPRPDAALLLAREARRGCEASARRGNLDAARVAQIVERFDDGDVASAQAARIALSRLDAGARTTLARELAASPSAPRAAHGLLCLASATDERWSAADVARAFDGPPEFAAIRLRALSIAAQRGLASTTDVRAAIDARATRPTSAASAWEHDALDAHGGGARALDGFLARAEAATQHVDALRAAWLASSTSGWTPRALQRFLAWYETTRGWEGGASFRGYIEAFRDRAAADDAVVAGLLRDEEACARLAAPALAYALRRAASMTDARRAELGVDADALTPRATRLAAIHAALPSAGERRATIAEATGVRDEALLAWLRTRARRSEEERGPATIALARVGRATDAPIFVAGLDSPEFGVPKACADALAALPEPPTDAATWAGVLERARTQGHPRGWPALRVLARWLELPAPTVEAARFDEAWRRLHGAARVRLPALAEAARPSPRPAYDVERVRRFLRETADRPASAGEGERVFARATCASCHTVNGRALAPELSKGASGPDLGGVARRLRGDELYDAVARPSLAIADQFRALVVETHDGRRFEGRAHRDDARGVALVESDGRAVEIDAHDVLEKRASTVSAMPEGLLAALTLEEVRDLFAFLRADGAPEPVDVPWRPMFGATLESDWQGGGGHFALEDGVLVGRAPNIERSEYLVSRRDYADFEVEFDVRITRGGNSGLQYRSAADRPTGWQADVGQLYWGSLYASDGRGVVHAADALLQRAAVDLDGWNHYVVRVEGDRHVIEVNGRVLTDVRDGARSAGRLAWQLHEGLDMEVRVANARVRARR